MHQKHGQTNKDDRRRLLLRTNLGSEITRSS